MNLIRKHKKKLSIFFLILFINSFVLDFKLFAITGHNSMPEYRSFEPVSTANMVNLFDGSFVYNIPLIDIPNGYPINLSYHSNEITNETQASWVGLGWTINPGAINRIKRGFPDEFNGDSVTYHTKAPANWTASVAVEGGLEIFSEELGGKGLGLDLGASIRYNNYKGVGRSIYGGISATSGMASLNFTYSAGEFGFNPSINPAAILQFAALKSIESQEKPKNAFEESLEYKHLKKIDNMLCRADNNTFQLNYSKDNFGFGISGQNDKITGSSFNIFSVPPQNYPIPQNSFEGLGVNLSFEIGINLLPVPIDPELRLKGSYMQQEYKDTRIVEAYGYFNSDNIADSSGNKFQMDYLTENETTFEKRDRILGIPLPNNDIFSLTGEALGGTFRAFRSDFGHYMCSEIESESIAIDATADINLASHLSPVVLANEVYTAGGNLGGSYNNINVSCWDNAKNKYKFQNENSFSFNSNEKFVLRFSGDLAGNFIQTNNDSPLAPIITGDSEIDVNLSGQSGTLNQRNLRSSYISMSINNQFSQKAKNNVPYSVQGPNLWIKNGSSWINYNNSRSNYGNNGIAEITTYNSDGIKYVYGLPIHTRNEKNVQFSLKPGKYDLEKGLGLIANAINFSNIDEFESISGYESNSPYATQFLLTQITSSDYIDRTFNGLTPDDFGNYTRFNYTRIAGGNNWYKFRTPFEGLSFNYGSLSDNSDDMGSVSFGEKELYYIWSICSKTHVAIFELEDRNDGVNSKARNTQLKDIINPSGGNEIKLKKLNSIKLYSINDCEQISNDEGTEGIFKAKDGAIPIKSVYFEYNYSLCKNIPNNTEQGEGKLTLKKIWFEYKGKATSKISPYVFYYEYPDCVYPSPYEDFQNIGEFFNKTDEFNPENPNYSVLNTDRWGNYRNYDVIANTDNLGNLARFFPYVYQNTDYSEFDPAAWCLKRIVLPSGGEIHIQYEQHDYQYIQDKRAMVMVPLLGGINYTLNSEVEDKKYFLDLEKIGIQDAEINSDLVDELFQPMLGKKSKNRLYFNFLYRLVNDEPPNFTNNKSEYIEGYARISGYGIKNNKAFFVFTDEDIDVNTEITHYVSNNLPSNYNTKEIPKKACENFYNNNRQGKLTGAANALSEDTDRDGESTLNTVLEIASQATGLSEVCMQIDPKMSYVRLQLPLNKPKKGGGVRVKRLLMYDDGVGVSTVPSLYGQEFTYKSDGYSSGVATNEPSVGRRESPLVYPIDKKEQSGFEALLYGRDMYKNEVPLGESLLPGPSIGYSKVIVQNIHKGKTSTGYEVHEFHTVKDYPMEGKDIESSKYYTHLKTDPKGFGQIGGGIGIGPVGISGSYSDKTMNSSQGFCFVLNDMHGKIKRISKYSLGSNLAVEEEIYEYFPLGSPVKVMNEKFEISEVTIGKESEILFATKQVSEYTAGASVGVDVSAGGAICWPCPFPVPFPVVIPMTISLGGSYDGNTLRTGVVTKIIKQTGILKKVTKISNGVKSVKENIVFDKYTGNPLIIRSYDEFNNNFINQDFKASYKYPNFRSKATNENLIASEAIFLIEGDRSYIQFINSSNNECGQAQKFIKGDLIEIESDNINDANKPALYHVTEIDLTKDRIYVIKSGLSMFNINSEIDINSIRVIKSGYTNQMNLLMGDILINSIDLSYYKKIAIEPSETSHPIVEDLNNALKYSNLNEMESQIIILKGPYKNMTIETDTCVIKGSCDIDNNGLTLRNIYVLLDFIENENGSEVMTMQIIELEAKRDSQNETEFIRIDCSNNGIIKIKGRLMAQPNSNQFVNSKETNNSDNKIKEKLDNECKEKFPEAGNINCLKQTVSGNNNSDIIRILVPNSGTEFFPENYAYPVYVNQSYRVNTKIINYSSVICDSGTFVITGPNSEVVYQKEHSNRIDFKLESPGLYKIDYIQLFDSAKTCEHSKKENVFGYLCGIVAYSGYQHPDSCCVIPYLPFNEDKYVSLGIQDGTELPSNSPLIIPPQTELNIQSLINNSSDDDFCDEGVYTITGPYPNNEQVVILGRSLNYIFEKPGLFYIEYKRLRKNLVDSLPCQNPFVHKASFWVCVEVPYPSFRLSVIDQNPICINNEFESIGNIVKITGIQDNLVDNYEYYWKVEDHENAEITDPFSRKPDIKFFKPGEYLITLVMKDNCNREMCRQIKINVEDCKPDVSINVTPSECHDKKFQLEVISNNTVPIDDYIWDMGDGTMKYGKKIEYAYNDCEPHEIELTVSNSYGTNSYTLNYPGNRVITCHSFCDCISEINVRGLSRLENSEEFVEQIGRFYLGTDNSTIIFKQPFCPQLYVFDCISVCGSESSQNPDELENVISASASTFTDEWPYDTSYYPFSNNSFQLDSFELGMKGKWRPFEQYVYREAINGGTDKLINKTGKFTLKIFDWENTLNNNSKKWVKTSTITRYSPNGNAIEDKNILDIHSTAKYGYNNTLPILVAQNAKDHTVIFEGFENLYNINSKFYLDDGQLINNDLLSNLEKHTGNYSLKISPEVPIYLGNIQITDDIRVDGIQFVSQLWIKTTQNSAALNDRIKLIAKVNGVETNLALMKKISGSGEWSLFKAKFRLASDIIGDETQSVEIGIRVKPDTYHFGTIHIDDFRVQPLESEMVCYVYDKSQRLIAVLDDQHYALIYEYNSEGILVRKLKETIRGIKTISETQYNTKGVPPDKE